MLNRRTLNVQCQHDSLFSSIAVVSAFKYLILNMRFFKLLPDFNKNSIYNVILQIHIVVILLRPSP
jgi:hypothetical protein